LDKLTDTINKIQTNTDYFLFIFVGHGGYDNLAGETFIQLNKKRNIINIWN
jgi:hypothetical protein